MNNHIKELLKDLKKLKIHRHRWTSYDSYTKAIKAKEIEIAKALGLNFLVQERGG